jgi:alginate O-acetyltransferase complex protein AlgI
MMQLYFDFSGYSDMAIGLGKMMGFRFMENFDTPYVSRSITEFWRRWHISLSTWLRDYLYIPLGGNRVGPVRTYFNLMTVMVLGGLWHGAAWTFVLWGLWHGGWLAVERATGLARSSSLAGLLRTLLIVIVGWVMFRALTVGDALDMYAGMLGLNGIAMPAEAAFGITREGLFALALCLAVVTLEPRFNRLATERWSLQPGGVAVLENTLLPTLAVTGIAALAILRLAEQSFSPFLYFQF